MHLQDPNCYRLYYDRVAHFARGLALGDSLGVVEWWENSPLYEPLIFRLDQIFVQLKCLNLVTYH
jgi:hypothetical protein